MEQKPTERIFELPEEVLLNVLKLLSQLPHYQADPHIKAIQATAKEKVNVSSEPQKALGMAKKPVETE